MNDEATTPQEGAASADPDSIAQALGTLDEAPAHPDANDTPQDDAPAVAGNQDAEAASSDDDEQPEAPLTLEAIAERLEMTPEQLLGAQLTATVDGEKHDVTLADLRKSYQLEGHVNRKSVELSDAKKAWESEQTKQAQQWQQRMAIADQMLNLQEQQLAQQYNAVDWQSLASDDPAQYSATLLQFQQAQQQLAGYKQAVSQQWQQGMQQMQQQQLEHARPLIRSQNTDLVDEASYTDALASMKSYLKSKGANEASMAALERDPLVFGVVRDAMRYHDIASRNATTAKKVKAAPKFVSASNKSSRKSRQAELAQRATKGDEAAAAELFGTF